MTIKPNLTSRQTFVVRPPSFYLFIYSCYLRCAARDARNEFTSSSVKSHNRAADTSSTVFWNFPPHRLLTPLKYFIKYFGATVITWPYWLTFNFPIPSLFSPTLPFSSTLSSFARRDPLFPETLELAVKLAYSEVSQFNGWVPQRAELSNLLSSRADVLKQLVQTM